jgi:hypothetical protein
MSSWFRDNDAVGSGNSTPDVQSLPGRRPDTNIADLFGRNATLSRPGSKARPAGLPIEQPPHLASSGRRLQQALPRLASGDLGPAPHKTKVQWRRGGQFLSVAPSAHVEVIMRGATAHGVTILLSVLISAWMRSARPIMVLRRAAAVTQAHCAHSVRRSLGILLRRFGFAHCGFRRGKGAYFPRQFYAVRNSSTPGVTGLDGSPKIWSK